MNNYVYVHIPFCLSKCAYCSFISFENAFDAQEKYFEALNCEIKTFFENNQKSPLKTLYIGGGTPSIVPIELYKKYLDFFKFEDEYEFTFEVNPATVTRDYLYQLHEFGVNRLSIGVQSFDDKILRFINRRHCAKDAIECFEDARRCGFDNISVDLIYGLPSQTFEILESSLESALSLGSEHISIYGLKIEEGSKFFDVKPQNLPTDDDCADMYLEIVDTLCQNGFEQYEISNFAKPQKFSRHNMNYWNNNEYAGFGLAAHGYLDSMRYSHEVSLDSYISNPFAINHTKVSEREKKEDEIILNLRTKKGIDLGSFKQKFDTDFCVEYKELLQKYSDFFVLTPTHAHLSTEGFLVSNFILSEFLDS